MLITFGHYNRDKKFSYRYIPSRLAAIDGVGGDTGVKPQHRLRHLPTAAPSLTVI